MADVVKVKIDDALPGSSALIILRDDQGRFLFQFRDADATINPLTWGLWGGRTEAEDATTQEAAQRELREELGLNVSPEELRPLAIAEDPSGRSASLFLLSRRIGWKDIIIQEGAGGAFFRLSALTQLEIPRTLIGLLRTLEFD